MKYKYLLGYKMWNNTYSLLFKKSKHFNIINDTFVDFIHRHKKLPQDQFVKKNYLKTNCSEK